MNKVVFTLGVCAVMALLVPMSASAQFTHNSTTSINGGLGVGQVSPVQRMEVFQSTTGSVRLRLENSEAPVDFFTNDGNIGFIAGGFQRMVITPSGQMGVNTAAPASAFHVRQGGAGGNSITIENGEGTAQITANDNTLQLRIEGAPVLIVSSTTVTVPILEITGGSDLSEQFEIQATAGAVEPGTVVCIDATRPGELAVSDQAYARTVAGIVSGAGGLKTGMMMGQQGSLADGKHPVALTGRVYCKVDASNGAIQPGDLLTTSNLPGHAMKVTDFAQAQGAIIGKAMTPLEEGTGLVLVLVSLQ